MRLSTSNFSVKVAAFAAIIAVSLAAMEWYARTSSAFASGEQWMIGKYTTSDPSNAVFGDSQIGRSNRIDGFEFFGWAGTEPDELERLVKYIYTFKKPKRVIFELAPQLFSDYEGREEFVTWKNLPFRYLPLLISSPYFYEDMKRVLGLDTKDLIGRIVTSAHASTLSPPDKEASANSQGRWAAAVDKVGGGYNFNWDTLGVDDRHLLSLSRVFSQNPIDGFATSEKMKLPSSI